MKRIGSIRYPDNILDIIKDKEMVSALYHFAREALCHETILFLMSPQNTETLYLKFIAEGSPHQINIPGSIRTPLIALGEAKSWADPRWENLIRRARADVASMFDSDPLFRFWSSEQFWEYHRAKGGNDTDTEISPVMEAAEALQLQNHKALDAYIKAYKTKGEDATLTLATKLLLSERKRMNVTDFNRFLMDRGLITAPETVQAARPAVVNEDIPPPPPRLEIEIRRLKLCGFDNVGGVIFQERCYEMIECYLNNEKTKARTLYEKILKDEPKQSRLHDVPLVELMKTFKEKKVYRDLANKR